MNKQEYNKIAKEVVKRYRENILPKFKFYEAKRIKNFKISLIILVTIIVLSLFAFYVTSEAAVFYIFFIVFFGFLILYGISKKFENEVKKSIMPYLCECFCDLQWDDRILLKCYPDIEKFIIESNLFIASPNPRFYYDDVFSGKFRDLNFKIMEFNCIVGYGRKKYSSWAGVCIVIETNKTTKGNTIIRQDSLLHVSPVSKLKHTVLEDVEFEKKYDVYTDDEVEARYVITTAFMERLNNIQMSFSVDKISCAFFEKYLLIGLYTKKDTFKFAKLNKSLTDYTEFSRLFKEIMSIYEMIDYFKLAEKTKL